VLHERKEALEVLNVQPSEEKDAYLEALLLLRRALRFLINAVMLCCQIRHVPMIEGVSLYWAHERVVAAGTCHIGTHVRDAEGLWPLLVHNWIMSKNHQRTLYF